MTARPGFAVGYNQLPRLCPATAPCLPSPGHGRVLRLPTRGVPLSGFLLTVARALAEPCLLSPQPRRPQTTQILTLVTSRVECPGLEAAIVAGIHLADSRTRIGGK